MDEHNPIETQLRSKTVRVTTQRERRILIRVAKRDLRRIVRKLIKLDGFSHLSTITGIDIGTRIELIYHMVHKDALISLKIRASKKKPIVPSIVDLISGAILYEREIHDLLGIEFEENPDLSPLILPDAWPDGVYPLRKEWTLERISEKTREP